MRRLIPVIALLVLVLPAVAQARPGDTVKDSYIVKVRPGVAPGGVAQDNGVAVGRGKTFRARSTASPPR